ncbi:unnamed protein product [Owenia fusiformis]|uniref:EF-hand domain-containing protein n=1 Tax=Owenia fusiformis TaxID=6347 RepID=A0A8S4N321_OWEFU|nr:unnamed protein product [Owenia fusiformis]
MSDTNTSSDIQIRQLPLTWMRKMLTILLTFDKDKDGVMGYEDHMQVVDKFVREANLTGKARDGIYQTFQDYCTSGESQGIPNSPSVAQQLLTVWIQKDNPETVEKWYKIQTENAQLLSLDVPGFMTFDNYMVYWNGLGLDKRFARMQFDYMDTNNDGLISHEEFANGYLEYMCNTDQNNLNRYFGPLMRY